MTQLRCAHCGGKFGLVYQRHGHNKLCSKRCKAAFTAKLAAERESIRRWLKYLGPT